MPFIDYAEAEDFHGLYDGAVIEGPLGRVSLGYHRASHAALGADHARGLVDALGITASDVVVIIGCGFGWVVEAWKAILPGANVVGVDVSAYVHSAKDQTETDYLRARIVEAGLDPDTGEGAELLARYDTGKARTDGVVVLNEDVRNGAQAEKAIREALGIKRNETIHWAISDDLLTSLGAPGDDSEITDNIGAMNALADQCAHLVMPLASGRNQDTRLNWKTMEQWRTLFDGAGMTAHRLVRTGDYAVF